MASAEAAAATYHGSGWLAGFLAVLVQVSDVFERSPVLGFIVMGLLGAFAGFGLMMEQGKYDEVSGRRQLRSLGLRLGIGFVIGVGAGVMWSDGDGSGSKGAWMLCTGIIAAAPIDMFKVAVEVVSGIIRRKADK